jgi:glycosyltransferase-like protein
MTGRPWVDSLRIAILTRSTQPCSSTVHALALGEALCAQGHEAVVHAPDPSGRGFFRDAECPVVSVSAKPVTGTAAALVGARIADYLAHFSTPAACDFDIFHAQCGISGNAVATLTRRRLIPGFVRTVHHVTAVAESQLAQWRERAIVDAGRLLCVSRTGAAALLAEFGTRADMIGHGVDGAVYRPEPEPGDGDLRRRLGLGAGPVFLSVGGFALRKNTLTIIEAFAAVRQHVPDAQLLVAGGDARPDHAGYEARCCALLELAGLAIGPGQPVVRVGPMAQADMPGLYRIADTLIAPSLTGGYGLCVLEAMACGTPAIISAQSSGIDGPALVETLAADPDDAGAIASAMRTSLEPARRAQFRNAGREVARAHTWETCAARHLPIYESYAPGPAPLMPAATGSAAWNIQRLPRDT